MPAIISRTFWGGQSANVSGGTLITRGVDSGGDNTPRDNRSFTRSFGKLDEIDKGDRLEET